MAEYGSLPFAEQIEFFRQKHPELTAAWTDIYAAEHDHAFMVAGAAKADLLADFRAAVDKAIAEGTTLQAFRRDFDTIVEKHGWSYNGGRNWRTRVIYETNLRQSYHAGREAQMADPELQKRRPYGLYRHGGSEDPRPEHLAWDGLVLPLDDPWWDTHTPQNGWGCKCKKRMISAADAERMGLSVADAAPAIDWEEKTVGIRGPSPRTVKVPKGIDPGFEYRPGKSRAAEIMAKTRTWPVDMAATFADGLTGSGREAVARDFGRWIDDTLAAGRAAGRGITVGAIGAEELAWLRREKGVTPLRADITLDDRLVVGKKAIRHEAAGDALTAEEWRTLPTLQREAVLYDNDTGNVLYVLTPLADSRKVKMVVALDYKTKGKDAANSVRTVFKVGGQALGDSKKYVVIRGEIKK